MAQDLADSKKDKSNKNKSDTYIPHVVLATVENYMPWPTNYTISNLLLYEQIKSLCLISTYPTIPKSFLFANFLLFQPIPPPSYINSSLSVYHFHESEPSLGKSKESNHQGINVQEKLVFLPPKKTRIKMTRSASYFPELPIH